MLWPGGGLFFEEGEAVGGVGYGEENHEEADFAVDAAQGRVDG